MKPRVWIPLVFCVVSAAIQASVDERHISSYYFCMPVTLASSAAGSPMDEIKSNRAQAIRARIIISNAMCAIAESEINASFKRRALETIGTVQHTIQDVTLLLGQADYVSASDARELEHVIRQLNDRVEKIEMRITRDGAEARVTKTHFVRSI